MPSGGKPYNMTNKQLSSTPKQFAKGGSTKMHGKSGVVPQKPGVTASSTGPMSKEMLKGGGKKMVGKQTASPAKAR